MEFMSNVSPEDVLAYILCGDWNGDDYELNPDQVERTREVVEKLAMGRMAAITEVPPVDPNDMRVDKSKPKDDLPN